MTASSRSDAQINLRLSSELKQTIEAAALLFGQSVSESALSTVVREARRVLYEAQVTRLSNRDREEFLKALDAVDSEPNAALTAAALRHGVLRG